jgi:hypothetical protein
MRNTKYHTVGTVLQIPHGRNSSKNTTRSEQFQNIIPKTETNSIPLIHIYMTADFPGLVHPLSLLVAMLKTTFGSSSPPVVNRGAHVLFALFVFVFVWWCPTRVVYCFSSYCVPCAASFSGLAICDYPFGIL